MKTFQVFLFLSLVVFGSCSDRQFYKTYSTKIDSLSSSLEASASTYETIDTTFIVAQYDVIKQNIDSIKQFPEVSLDPLIIEYRYNQKKFKIFLRDHPLNIRELNYCRQQLSDLKDDFSKRSLDVEPALEYYNIEEDAVVEIKKRMNAYQILIDKATQRFDTLNPEFINLLDSLDNTIQN